MTVKDILRDSIEESDLQPEALAQKIKGITISARENCLGHLFIHYSSKQKLNFTEDNKPIAIVTDKSEVSNSGVPIIRVTDPRRALSFAYYRFYGPRLDKIKLIGITGTNGKTSTSLILSKILTDAGHCVGVIGTGRIELNGKLLSDRYYSMTTPDPWVLYKVLKEMIDGGCDTVIMEVSSHALALEKLAPLRFDYGVFTGFSSEHLDFHKTEDSYLKAKAKLFTQSEVGVFNIDDRAVKQIADSHPMRRITVGAFERGDNYATDIRDKGFDGIRYLYRSKSFSFRAILPISGIYNVYNSMLAAAVAIDMGIKPCSVRDSFRGLAPLPGRYEIIKDDVTVIIDYAHTDEAFRSILKSIRSATPPKKRVLTVFGCGGERDKEKRPRMAAAAEEYSDAVTVTADNTRSEAAESIFSDILKGFNGCNHEVIPDRSEAIRKAILSADRGDTVVLLGKGAERYGIDKNGYYPFDEREAVKKSLEERRRLNDSRS